MNHRWLLTLPAAVALALGLSACQAPVSHLYVVDSSLDAPDVAPGDGTCQTAAGDCTFRAAVDEANALTAAAGSDPAPQVTVELSTDVALTAGGAGDDANATGDVDVRADLTVRGEGRTIEATTGTDRVLDVRSGSLTLDQVRITGGRTVIPAGCVTAGCGGDGGALRSAGDTTVNIVRTTFEGNRADSIGTCVLNASSCSRLTLAGGGGVASDGRLNIVASSFVDNLAASPASCQASPFGTVCSLAYGGAVLARGSTVVVDSTFTGNDAGGSIPPTVVVGDGAALALSSGATVELSTLVDNGADPATAVAAGQVRGSIVLGTGCGAPTLDASLNLRSSACPGAPADDGGVGAFGDHGGGTATFLPDAASPAVDAIPPGTARLCDGSIGTDQRALPRQVGAGCDVGAVERQPSD